MQFYRYPYDDTRVREKIYSSNVVESSGISLLEFTCLLPIAEFSNIVNASDGEDSYFMIMKFTTAPEVSSFE